MEEGSQDGTTLVPARRPGPALSLKHQQPHQSLLCPLSPAQEGPSNPKFCVLLCEGVCHLWKLRSHLAPRASPPPVWPSCWDRFPLLSVDCVLSSAPQWFTGSHRSGLNMYLPLDPSPWRKPDQGQHTGPLSFMKGHSHVVGTGI